MWVKTSYRKNLEIEAADDANFSKDNSKKRAATSELILYNAESKTIMELDNNSEEIVQDSCDNK